MNSEDALLTSATHSINDCWNKIGVQGDFSCPELKRHVHCRNCPVYSAAAAELFDGELPADYSNDWTTHFAQERQTEAADTSSVLIFRIGTEWLALPTVFFVEITEVRAIHSLPHRRGGNVRGLVSVRGELLICVSISHLLGLEDIDEAKKEKHRTTQPRLLVVSHEANRLAFSVDEVEGICRFRNVELLEVPATLAKATAKYTKSVLPWRKGSVGLLDEALLFYALNRSLSLL